MAGVYARTDATRGVWKAPAGTEAALRGVRLLDDQLTDARERRPQPARRQRLRNFPIFGNVGWGARTLDGADQQASEWKYIPVRRTALFIEESLYRGTKWVVFEPNDEPLWAQIRLNVGAFMHGPLPPGRLPGHDAARGLLRQVRQGDDDAERHQPRHRQHPRRLRAAQAGRVRRHQDPADRRPDRRRKEDGRRWPSSASTPQRFDPYKNFKFRVKWDGRYVAGISKVSALKRTTEVVKHREGGDPSSSRKSPGRTEYEAITLERGVTHDPEFEQWANKVWNFGAGLGAEVSLKDFRKDIIIEVYNEAGQLALAYKVFRCWVSEYQALPDLDANANAVAIQTHQARERGLGARRRGARAGRAGGRPVIGVPHAEPDSHLLEVWTNGRMERPGRRTELLLAAAGLDPASDPTLGAVDARLLDFQEGTFGPHLDMVVDCPACRQTAGAGLRRGRPACRDLGTRAARDRLR